MTTAAEMAARKREQEQEGNAREAQRNGAQVEAGEGVVNDDLHDDGLDSGHDGGERSVTPRASEEADEPAPKRLPMSPADEARAQIAKRWRRDAEGEVPFNGDMTDPEMLYGRFGRHEEQPDPNAPEPGVPPQAAAPQETMPAEEPTRKKFMVRGKEVWLTDDEIIARVQKIEAADSYLEESKRLLDEAKQIKAERAGRDRQHPDGQSSTHDDVQEIDDGSEHRQHPGDKLKQVVEKIQYGDPEEAARDLGEVIAEEADKKANERQLKRLMDNDLAKAQKALQSFEAANPDLAKDEIASKVIEANIYKVYREDIAKLGVVDEDKIPTDPKELANWHRFYRVHGYAVQDVPQILEEAKNRLNKWRGPSNQPTERKPARTEPRVDVNVDRTARRQVIPNQPSRSTAPRPDQQQGAPRERSRSSVIANMRKARGQI